MNYTITQSQANRIFNMLSNVTDELLTEARKLESLYKLNLITGTNDNICAWFFDYAIEKLKLDKDNYLYNEFMLLKDKQKSYDKLTFPERITGSQKPINDKINEVIEQYIFNNYNELRTFINVKQPIFENTFKAIDNFLMENINGSHGINITDLIQTKVSERKKYIDKYVFNRKNVNTKRMALIDSLLHIKTFLNVETAKGMAMPNNFLLAMLYNYIDDNDKDLSIQKLNNMLTQIEYEN